MKTAWNELDWPVRVSLVMSFVGVVVLMTTFLLLAGEGGTILSGSDPVSAIALLASPIISGVLLIGGFVLLFLGLSAESRGIIGFLLLIASIGPTLVFVLLLLFLLRNGFPLPSTS